LLHRSSRGPLRRLSVSNGLRLSFDGLIHFEHRALGHRLLDRLSDHSGGGHLLQNLDRQRDLAANGRDAKVEIALPRDLAFVAIDVSHVGACILDLCAAVEQLIEKHEAHALTAAIEEVANRLSSFLNGNRLIGARERVPYADAIETIKSVRYASTLWAATRRNGEYSGLSVSHQIGIGTARDARLRSKIWFKSLEAFLNGLKADAGLALATKTIDQISKSAAISEKAFLEAVQRAGTEIYREPLAKSPIWSTCSSEWGKGKGFTGRVANHLEGWFEGRPQYKERLEMILSGLWEKVVISPLARLAEEGAPEAGSSESNVVDFPSRLAS
jgi:hypothetical protein